MQNSDNTRIVTRMQCSLYRLANADVCNFIYRLANADVCNFIYRLANADVCNFKGRVTVWPFFGPRWIWLKFKYVVV